MKSSGFKIPFNEVLIEEGNIIEIEPNGDIWVSDFEMHETEKFFDRLYNWYEYLEPVHIKIASKIIAKVRFPKYRTSSLS